MHSDFITKVEWLNFPDYPGKVISCRFIATYYKDDYFSEMKAELPHHLYQAKNKRKAEFYVGRWLANKALRSLSLECPMIQSRKDNSPLWPIGIAGAISHTSDAALCAVHREPHIGGVGIDIENWLSQSRANLLQRAIATPKELAALSNNMNECPQLLSLVFSAKESLFKVIYPRTGIWFGFEDAQVIEIDWCAQTFSIVLIRCLTSAFKSTMKFKGHFRSDENTITTFVYYDSIGS